MKSSFRLLARSACILFPDEAVVETTDAGNSGDVLKSDTSFHCTLEGFLTHRQR
jgi:hypothetical protein